MGEELSRSARSQAEFTGSHWRAMREFVLVGLTAIIAGGLVAAVTGPTGFDEGSWVAAYLVLVAGVAQVGLGVGQALLTDGTLSGGRRVVQLLAYNLANSAVLAGTLTGSVVAVTVGGVLLLVAHVVPGHRAPAAFAYVVPRALPQCYCHPRSECAGGRRVVSCSPQLKPQQHRGNRAWSAGRAVRVPVS